MKINNTKNVYKKHIFNNININELIIENQKKKSLTNYNKKIIIQKNNK